MIEKHFTDTSNNSAIHKPAGLTVPSRSMILPGTIPETPINREWSRRQERVSEVVPTGRTPGRQLVNSAVTALLTKPPAEPFPALPGTIPEKP